MNSNVEILDDIDKVTIATRNDFNFEECRKNWNWQYQFTPILLLAFDFEIRLSRVLFRIGTKSGHYNNLKVNQKSKTAILDVIINF